MSASYESDPTFCAVIGKVLDSEGGFIDDPLDPGGPTKYGIAWNYNSAFLKSIGITRATMRDLTVEQAKQIYYNRYWLASDANGITDEALAYEHLDCAVNNGVGAAQRILGRLSRNPKNFDGTDGRNRTIFLRLLLEYTALRLWHYTHCDTRTRDRFLAGWANRIVAVINNALEMQ